MSDKFTGKAERRKKERKNSLKNNMSVLAHRHNKTKQNKPNKYKRSEYMYLGASPFNFKMLYTGLLTYVHIA